MEMEGTEMQEEDWEGLCEMFKARAEQKGIEMDDTALRAMAQSFVATSATILGRAKAHLRPPRALTEMADSTSGESAARSGQVWLQIHILTFPFPFRF